MLRNLMNTSNQCFLKMAEPNKDFKNYLSKFSRQPAKQKTHEPAATSAANEDEKQVLSRTLPDYIRPGLDMLIVGINPGYMSARHGHYYAGAGNHFWKCMYDAGLFRLPVDWRSDYKLVDWGIGLTNLVGRATRGQEDILPEEFIKGANELRDKIAKYEPKVVVFNGRKIFEIFQNRTLFKFGRQPKICNTEVYVMPSTSPRSALYGRSDKMPFFLGLKKLVDHVKHGTELGNDELTFEPKKLSMLQKSPKKTSPFFRTNAL